MLRTAESISDIHKVGSYGHIVWNQCINIGFTYATATATSSIFYQNNKQHSFYLPFIIKGLLPRYCLPSMNIKEY